jgi:hypothetical protein
MYVRWEDEWVRTEKDAVVACFSDILRHLPRETEENYEKISVMIADNFAEIRIRYFKLQRLPYRNTKVRSSRRGSETENSNGSTSLNVEIPVSC